MNNITSHTLKTACIGLTSLFALQVTSAATVAYWRFESGDYLGDSGSNELDLTQTGNPISPTTPPADFWNPIDTGAGTVSNTGAALAEDNDRMTATDFAAYDSPTATIEMLVNLSDLSGPRRLLTHGANNGWNFIIANFTHELRFSYDSDGSSGMDVIIDSGLSLSENVSYYTALTWDLSDFSAGLVTFYLQDLTNQGTMQSASFATPVGVLSNSPDNLIFGETLSIPTIGILDEVRISDTVLNSSEFLTVPEPSSIVLMFMGALVFGLGASRRKRS